LSLVVARSNLLSLSPKTRKIGRRLTSRTNFLLRLLTLLSYDRVVTIDGARGEVVIDTTWLWFFKRQKKIPFTRIAAVLYNLRTFGTDWGFFTGFTDQYETYAVGLNLQSPHEDVELAAFRGEGSVSTGTTGVLLGDDIVDFSGDQEDTSRGFVEQLREIVGPLPIRR